MKNMVKPGVKRKPRGDSKSSQSKQVRMKRDVGTLPEPMKSIMEEFNDIEGTDKPTLEEKLDVTEKGEDSKADGEGDGEELNLPSSNGANELEEPSRLRGNKLKDLKPNEEKMLSELESASRVAQSTTRLKPGSLIHGREAHDGVIHDMLCPECFHEMEETVPVCCIQACGELASAHLFCGEHAEVLKRLVQHQIGIEDGSISKTELNDEQHKEILTPVSNPNPSRRKRIQGNKGDGKQGPGGVGELSLPSIGITMALEKVSAEMDGLKKEGEDSKVDGMTQTGYKRRKCEVAECQSTARLRGRCIRHGGGKKCSIDGCQTSAYARGLCVKHGGGKRCIVNECLAAARYRSDFCKEHANERVCEVEGCEEFQWRKRLCKEHLKRFGNSETVNRTRVNLNVSINPLDVDKDMEFLQTVTKKDDLTLPSTDTVLPPSTDV